MAGWRESEPSQPERCFNLPGVSTEPSGPRPQPQPQTFYAAVGGEPTFRRIAARFYEQVAVDDVLRPLYPDGDLAPAEERMRLFLIQFWGGPTAYRELRGETGLAARHVRFKINRTARDAWLRAMRVAVDEAELSDAHRAEMWERFEIFAYNMTTHAG